MIKAIIWDMGGVLNIFVDYSWHRKWENQLGLAPGQLEKIVFSDRPAVIGKATPAEVWQDVGETLSLSTKELVTLEEDFWKGLEWDADLFDYIRSSLKGRYKLGILSDAWLGTRERFQKWINYDLFDVIMFSAEEGVRKPNPEMYRRILSRLDIEANEAIFIDDRADNIEGARAVGMYGIQFTDGFDIKNAIEEIAESA